MSIDVALRDTIREVVREEVRAALRDFRAELTASTAQQPAEFLSVTEAAQATHVHPSTVRAWINAGKLHAYRAGRHHRLKRSDLEQFLARLDGESVDLEARARELAGA